MLETSASTAVQPLSWARHVVYALGVAVVSLFTGFAWPFAILTGIVIGRAETERARGIRASGATSAVRLLAVTGGVLAMLAAGAIIGGLVAFLIAAIAAQSERSAADASPQDRLAARILLLAAPVAVWLVLIALGAQVSIRIGG